MSEFIIRNLVTTTFMASMALATLVLYVWRCVG